MARRGAECPPEGGCIAESCLYDEPMSPEALSKRFWWPSWACGVVLAWAAFFLTIAIVGSVMDDPAIEDASDFMAAVMAPMLLAVVVPCLWLAIGTWALIRTATRRSEGSNESQCLLSTPAAFAASVVAGAVGLYAVEPAFDDVMAGVVIHFAAGQLSAGVYLPFGLAVLMAWLCGRTRSPWATAALIAVSVVLVLVGSGLGLALGKHGA